MFSSGPKPTLILKIFVPRQVSAVGVAVASWLAVKAQGRYQTKLPSLQLTTEAFLGHPTVIQPQTDILINFYHHFLNWKSLTGRNLIHYIL